MSEIELDITINRDQALEALKEAVRQRGEGYIDPSAVNPSSTGGCTYVGPDGRAGCIVGVGLRHLGVPIEVLKEMDSRHDTLIHEGALGVLDTHGVHLDDRAVSAFKAAQEHQDGGHTWGLALHNAQRYS